MRKIIIFAGPHKTGTTSIQKSLGAVANQLLACGITYPLPSYRPVVGLENHTFIFRQVFLPGADPKLADYLAESITQTPSDQTILYIAEAFSDFPVSILQNIREFFHGLDCAVEIHMVHRVGKDWINSIFSQWIAGIHGPRLTFEAIEKHFAKPTVLLDRYAAVEYVFDRVIEHRFSDLTEHTRGPAGYVLDYLGVKAEVQNQRLNERLSEHTVRLMQDINTKIGTLTSNEHSRKFHLNLSKTCPELFSIPGVPFTMRDEDFSLPFRVATEAEIRSIDARFGFQPDRTNEPQKIVSNGNIKMALERLASHALLPVAHAARRYLDRLNL